MSLPQSQIESKGRRVSVDLSTLAAAEVDRLRATTELSTADLFRFALSLFRIYVEAKQSGQHLGIVGGENEVLTRIELPFPVSVESNGRPSAPPLKKEST